VLLKASPHQTSLGWASGGPSRHTAEEEARKKVPRGVLIGSTLRFCTKGTLCLS